MIKYFYLTLTGTTIPGQSGPESNVNKRVILIPNHNHSKRIP